MIGRLLLDMGRLFLLAALIGMLVVAAWLLVPAGAWRGALNELSSRLLGRQAEAYAMFPPDQTVYDNLLGADVPRVYSLWIPKISLEAPVVAVQASEIMVHGRQARQLHVPHAFAVGWSTDSAQVGLPGNTVLVGHNNIYGEVFKDLWQLQIGDSLTMRTASGDRNYRVSQVVTFEEQGLDLRRRLDNARWIEPSADERLTLVTCWPYWNNSHRLVVIAVPDGGVAG